MTNKGVFVSLIVSALMLAALLARNGQLLLLLIPFLVYLLIGILDSPTRISIVAERSLDDAEVAAGEPVQVRVRARNQGESLAELCVADLYPPAMAVNGHAQQRLALAAGESTEFHYTVAAPRGIYTWHEIEVQASDPFGLFELRQRIQAWSEVRVRPSTLKIRPIPFQPRETLHAPGPTAARLAGTGTDFWGIREYRPGDPLRRLNWRLGSRYPRRLFTNQFQGEEIADYGLIVDARQHASGYDVESEVFEASIRAAAAVAEAILSKGNRLALLLFGEQTSCLFPGYGKRQLSSVMNELCRARLGRSLPLQYLEYFPTRVFPAQSVIVVFSGLDARDAGTYARLRSYGYEVLLVSPSPVEEMARRWPQSRRISLAVRAARLERAAQLKRLMEMGVAAIDWDLEKPLDLILQGTTREMAHRRNL